MRLAATTALISLGPVAALAGGAPAGLSPPAPPSKQGAAASASVPPTATPAPKVVSKVPASGKSAGKTEGPVQTVLVTVENVESSKGDVSVALCDKGLSKDGCPFGTGRTAATGTMEFVFENIPPGNYAVVACQDDHGLTRQVWPRVARDTGQLHRQIFEPAHTALGLR